MSSPFSDLVKDALTEDQMVEAHPRVIRNIAAIEKGLKEAVVAIGKFKSDPRRYAPQLSNVAENLSAISSSLAALGRLSPEQLGD